MPLPETKYGPQRPLKPEKFSDFRTPAYMRGHGLKMIKDLERVARLYSGKLTKIFRMDGQERCPECTDTITGDIVVTDCDFCGGSGMKQGFKEIAEQWTLPEFGEKLFTSGEFGTVEGQGGKDPFIILGGPELVDRDLLIPVDTREVFKVLDVEPRIVALQGIVVAQFAQATMLSAGSFEYNLINW